MFEPLSTALYGAHQQEAVSETADPKQKQNQIPRNLIGDEASLAVIYYCANVPADEMVLRDGKDITCSKSPAFIK